MQLTIAIADRTPLVVCALVLAVGIVAAAVATTGAAAASDPQPPFAATDEEQPRAEAGVDQSVNRNATVLLDGTQSWSPNGELVDYNWTIETPRNETRTPTCETADCSLAHFRAPEFGRYAVELTVEDEVGATQTDVMYVETEATDTFGVDLTGPDATGPGTLTADVAAGNATLESLTWIEDDAALANQSLSGAGGVYQLSTSVDGSSTYTAIVLAADGRIAVDSWTPSTSSTPSRDYPIIEGPEELTDDVAYDAENDEYYFQDVHYRVETLRPLRADEVIWSRDGKTIDRGKIYTDDFAAGTHELTATVKFAVEDADASVLQHATGASEHVASFNGRDTAKLQVVANPEPQYNRHTIDRGQGGVTVQYRVREPAFELKTVRVEIDGEAVHRVTDAEEENSHRRWYPFPDRASGPTTVSIIAVDSENQISSKRRTFHLPTEEENDEDTTESEGHCDVRTTIGCIPRRPTGTP